MKGVTILDRDNRNILEVDLKDILHMLGDLLLNSYWKVSNVDAIGEASADEMHRLSDSGILIHGMALLKLASDVWQVVDGRFEAFRNGDHEPWCVIRAVDSSAYDVESDDENLLNLFRSNYRNVIDIPIL